MEEIYSPEVFLMLRDALNSAGAPAGGIEVLSTSKETFPGANIMKSALQSLTGSYQMYLLLLQD